MRKKAIKAVWGMDDTVRSNFYARKVLLLDQDRIHPTDLFHLDTIRVRNAQVISGFSNPNVFGWDA